MVVFVADFNENVTNDSQVELVDAMTTFFPLTDSITNIVSSDNTSTPCPILAAFQDFNLETI